MNKKKQTEKDALIKTLIEVDVKKMTNEKLIKIAVVKATNENYTHRRIKISSSAFKEYLEFFDAGMDDLTHEFMGFRNFEETLNNTAPKIWKSNTLKSKKTAIRIIYKTYMSIVMENCYYKSEYSGPQ